MHAAAGIPSATIGLDAGKKIRGRKRGIATDAPGLSINVVVTAANVHDNAIGVELLDWVAIDNPGVRTAGVDATCSCDSSVP
ncbi:transposase [Actinomadura sp. WMMB 499]|uniref:transposase n=1 Tax=Actinomadura sp. WMMB 499 TaxID=1219491 RepID=UPI001245C04C|nr:transposase [Actinomadura sp. WMMB 499]QFG21249.1 transposase [Actinomadura sp. WMMB 499]